MASHSPTTDPAGGHRHPVLRAALFAAAVLLMLLVLTPLADAAGRRGMDTGYDCVDVVGSWGWTGSSDAQVIHWPRGSGNVGIYTVGAAYDIHGIDMVTSRIGYLVTQAGSGTKSKVFKTTNGGKTWKPMGTALPPLVSVDFATRTIGYAVGSDGAWPRLAGRIFKLTDGGSTWQDQSATVDPAPPDYGLGCLKVLSTTVAYAEGQSEASLYTEDGLTWHLAHIATP